MTGSIPVLADYQLLLAALMALVLASQLREMDSRDSARRGLRASYVGPKRAKTVLCCHGIEYPRLGAARMSRLSTKVKVLVLVNRAADLHAWSDARISAVARTSIGEP
jgi:hypothetical protein